MVVPAKRLLWVLGKHVFALSSESYLFFFFGTTILLKIQAANLQPFACLLAVNCHATSCMSLMSVLSFAFLPSLCSSNHSCNSLQTEVLCVCSLFSRVQLFATPRTVGPQATHQAHLPMEFSRHTYWNGLPFSSPGLQGNLPWPRDLSRVTRIAGRFFTN